MQQKILCRDVNQMDMVDFLEKLGFHPTKIIHQDYWYLSPLRDEKTASFKVNRLKNVWFDFGSGKGGTLVDFGKQYYQCTVKDLLTKLSDEKKITLSFHQQKNTIAGEKKETVLQSKITILNSSAITDPTLRNYLNARKIPLSIANQYCDQVCFELNNKKHLAIGFKNESGGYELRNYYFKGSSTPKEPKLIVQKDYKDLAVFEGFFSFLSFQTLLQIKNKKLPKLSDLQANSLVLNSVAFFEKSRQVMEKHEHIHLFLDNDKTGKLFTSKALNWSKQYCNMSHHYKNYKDLSECLIKSLTPEHKQSHGQRLTR